MWKIYSWIFPLQWPTISWGLGGWSMEMREEINLSFPNTYIDSLNNRRITSQTIGWQQLSRVSDKGHSQPNVRNWTFCMQSICSIMKLGLSTMQIQPTLDCCSQWTIHIVLALFPLHFNSGLRQFDLQWEKQACGQRVILYCSKALVQITTSTPEVLCSKGLGRSIHALSSSSLWA